MIPPRRLLVATDFSAGSERAADTAIELAVRWRARVDWVHVRSEPSHVLAPSGQALLAHYAEHERHAAQDGLTALVERTRARGVVCDSHLERGRPEACIASLAEETDADWVVLGTHGRSGITALLLGSVAEKIARICPRSTLLVRSGPPLTSGGTVIFGEDFSPDTSRRVAAEVARALAARLVLVHGIDILTGLAANTSYSMPPSLIDSARSEAEAHLAKLAAELEGDVDSAVRLEAGAAALCDHARKTNAILVITATSSRQGLERWVLGSVAEKTLRHAPCSVLILKQPASPQQ